HEIEPVKHGLRNYLEVFHEMLDSIGATGFDRSKSVIPVGRSLSPINGGHRVAAGLLEGHPLWCRVVDEGLHTHNYNYLYFRNRDVHVAGGLSDAWLNAMALEYCRLKQQTYAVLVFPSATGKHQEVMDVLLAHGHVVYEKDFFLSRGGQLNLIRCVYIGEPWLGTSENDYNGANAKVSLCFANDGPLRFFLFETHDPQNAVKAKAGIRA